MRAGRETETDRQSEIDRQTDIEIGEIVTE